MRKILLYIMLLGSSMIPVVGQQVPCSSKDNVRISKDKPTVYLRIERKDQEKIWLRMYNNTIWAISVRTFSFYFNRQSGTTLINGKSVFALPSDREIDTLHYYIEKEPMAPKTLKVPELGYSDSSTISWIPSNGSIFFSVPRNQLESGLMVYVPFQFEWELSKQLIFNNESEHRVYFRGVDIHDR